MKIAWKITIIYTFILFFIIGMLSFIFYVNTRNILLEEHRKDLYKSLLGIGVGRGFMMGRMMGGRIASFYISENDDILQDPFGLGRVDKEGIYKVSDGSFVLIVKRGDYYLGKDITSTVLALDRLKITFFYVVLFGLIPSMLVGYFLSQRILSPIRRIIKDAQKVDVKKVGNRIELPNTKDELWELVNTLNLLFERIEKAYKREEEFSSDVSHELKTPLTSILGYIKMLKRWGKDDKKVLEESLDILETTTLDMINMVDMLLEISRVPERINEEEINLRDFLMDLKDKYTKMYSGFEFRMHYDRDKNLKIPRKILEMIINILVDNAVKNSLDRKEIEIGFLEDSFFVKDYGKGIPEEEISKIFERFYKIDKSRSSKGYGLGLSLAKKLAESVGFDIIVKSKEGEGSIFYIKIKER